MRFWLVSYHLNFQKNLLWHIWLCPSWNLIKKKLWYVSWCMVYRRPNLLITYWESAFWRRQKKLNHGKNCQCNLSINSFRSIKIKYNIPSISQNKLKISSNFLFKKTPIFVQSQLNFWNIHFFHFAHPRWNPKNFNDK